MTTWLGRYLPAAGLFVAGLAVWEAFVVVFDIQGFLLPRPSVIAGTFLRELPVVVPAGLFTLREAVGGFAMGAVLAVLAALATARWSLVREGILPFAVAANSTPIIALAPITNQWFGITNPLSKMTVVAVMVFFPVMINMVRGLTEVKTSELELMRSYAARPLEVLWKVRIPNSLPFLFSALKVGTALSVIGAIVAEYFGGSRQALGVYISQQAALFHFAEAWAAIIVGSVMGIGFYAVVLAAERLAMPWHVSLRSG
ncbi:MAG: ABC transporter permease [Acidimicrobiia bacterium]|nr:MAG: ABC transporter permease [Acidimicrobiia bacterium]